MSKLGYNERAWAVDVITAVNSYANVHQLEIRRAGGEHTLKQAGQTSLFPDVILFGDETGTRVRHGWEMKFPDTAVDDPATVENAARKAARLGVNSFLIWNVDSAQLHVQDDTGAFVVLKTWGPIGAKKRGDVVDLEAKWKSLLNDILTELNVFFASGALKSAPPAFLSDTFFVDFLHQHTGVTAGSIMAAAGADAKVEAEFSIWWASSPEGAEKDKPIDYSALAQAIIVGWINRLLFCHYLKGFRAEAAAVDTIEGDMSLKDGFDTLAAISAQYDFMQVFKPEAGANAIPNETWGALKQLNAFMADLATGAIQQEALRLALEGALSAARRKVRGQFTTPDLLADLLVGIGMENRTGPLIDPCCGTGTIPKAALAARVARGQTHDTALAGIWASDRFQFPLQFTTMALAEPRAMGSPLRVFRADVFTLQEKQQVHLAHPHDGTALTLELPAFSTVVSNLPFIRFETLARHDPDLLGRFAAAVGGDPVDGRSDLFAYIILYLKRLLVADGRICVIISNAWLGTEWGSELRKRLADDFHFDAVVTSGAGRWFANADVVTNILSLKRKVARDQPQPTRFVTTLKPIAEWDGAFVSAIATDVHGHQNSIEKPGQYRVRSYSAADVNNIEKQLIGWPGFFSDVSWIKALAADLVLASEYLDIARGERRGWDPMFLPKGGHGIEATYIKPVLINTKGVAGLIAIADGDAFCCSKTIDELAALGHVGAIEWITRFETQKNGTGKALTQVLATGGRRWYEMRTDTTADFAIGMNPDERVFTMRLNKRSFVNQRLIRLTVADPADDLDLLHALMNSSLSIFFIESSGFGRGLGALDLSATKLKDGLRLIDTTRFTSADRTKIVNAFKPLLARDVKRLDDEMASQDRIDLDQAILSAIGKPQFGPKIREAVTELYRIRKSVKG